jgi:molecular chaperone GrpE
MVDEIQGAQGPQEETVGAAPQEGESEVTQANLQQELEQAQNEVEQWRDRYLRSVAELANYRKRVEREREQQTLRLKMDVLRQLLPIADDFHLALENAPPDPQGFPWVQGLVLIADKIDALLSQSGVEPIPAVGEPFDPVYHHALMQEASDDYPEGVVSGEIRKGYTMGDQVLRPTLVRVSSGRRTSHA